MDAKFHRIFLFGNLIFIITLISLIIFYGFTSELNDYYKREVFIYGFSTLVFDLLCIIFLLYQTLVNNNEDRFFFIYVIVNIIELVFFIKYSSFLDENERMDTQYKRIEICFYLMFSYFLLHFFLFFCLIIYLLFILISVEREIIILNVEPSAPQIDDSESVRISIDNCIVCYEKEANKFLPCTHKLCEECYEKIKELNSLCPICREKY